MPRRTRDDDYDDEPRSGGDEVFILRGSTALEFIGRMFNDGDEYDEEDDDDEPPRRGRSRRVRDDRDGERRDPEPRSGHGFFRDRRR